MKQGRASGGIASSSVAGFARRQVYTDENATTPDIVDEIVIRQPFNQSMKAHIESTYEMSFPGGSFKIGRFYFRGV